MKIAYTPIFMLLLLPHNSGAHDFWLQAHPFIATAGQPIEISAHIGEALSGNSQPNILNWYTDFSYTYGQTRHDVPGEMGRDPAGIIERHDTGTFVVGYQSVRRSIDFKQQIFKRYLKQEGLQSYINEAKGENIVEYYTRFAKVLVKSGKDIGIDTTRTDFNYRFELHNLQNPYLL